MIYMKKLIIFLLLISLRSYSQKGSSEIRFEDKIRISEAVKFLINTVISFGGIGIKLLLAFFLLLMIQSI